VVLAVYDAISVYGTEHMLTLAEGVMDLNVPILLVVPTTLSFSMADLAVAEVGDPSTRGAGGGPTDAEAVGGPPTDAEDVGGRSTDAEDVGGRPTDPDGGDGADDPAGATEATGVDGPDDVAGATDGPGREALDAPDGTIEQGPRQRDALFLGLGDVVVPTVLVASAGFFLQQQAPPLVPGFALNLPALGGMIGTVAGLLGLLALVFRGRPHAGLPLLNGGTILGYLGGALAAGIPLPVALGL
jgi:hypothetical protein